MSVISPVQSHCHEDSPVGIGVDPVMVHRSGP